jgi:hypothetical protein
MKPYGLFPIWCCLRPGASHGLRAATMERSGFSNFLKQFEARRVPWFAGGYHGTLWIFGLKPSRLFPIWCGLRPGASHGLGAATMERFGFSKFQSDPVINWKFQSVPVINWKFQSDPVINLQFLTMYQLKFKLIQSAS